MCKIYLIIELIYVDTLYIFDNIIDNIITEILSNVI